jgi:predicted transcriptional regulator
MGLTAEQVRAFGKSPQTVKARALLCFRAHRKLGLSTIEIAAKLPISQPAVNRSSKRGEKIEKENHFSSLPNNA